jgi:HlyD family secretion protein
MKPVKNYPWITLGLAICLLTGCSGWGGSQSADKLSVSGFISAREIRISPEIGGSVSEVTVAEGQAVQKGDVLFRLEGDTAQAQYDLSASAVDAAKAVVASAESQQTMAQDQYDQALQGAQLQDQKDRLDSWTATQSSEIHLPVWYFQKDEQISALQNETKAAASALDVQIANLDKVLKSASSEDFIKAETTLGDAQAAFKVADLALSQAQDAKDNEKLKDAAQKTYDSALATLKSAQNEYDRQLSSTAAQDVLEARAQVAAAHARLDAANDQINLLQTGSQSWQVKVAQDGIHQAETGLNQAKANQQQAENNLKLAKLQLDKTVIYAPISGVILTLNLKQGELIPAGSVVATLGNLDDVELTVYVPEDQYGRIQIGKEVTLKADSFPNKTYSGKVTSISNEAEFTPRNVQTTSGRKMTVYAVKIDVPNPAHDLKAGMPVDAEFDFSK